MTTENFPIELKAATLSASECDDVQIAMAVSRLRDNLARRWPMGVGAAMQNLALRGYAPTLEFVTDFAARNTSSALNGEILFSGQQVEQLAEALAAAGMFNEWAQQRASEGVTGARFVEMMQAEAMPKQPFFVGKMSGVPSILLGASKTTFEAA